MLCLLFANCSHPAKKNETVADQVDDNAVKEISIMEDISKSNNIYLSSVASGIEYSIMETGNNCLVHHQMHFYCTKDYIVSIGSQTTTYQPVCFVFDRKGKFVRQISRLGQGPGEYTEVVETFWDDKNEQVCVWSHPYYIFYNLDGTISHRINRNEHPISFQSSFVYGDYYVRYIPNQTGNEKKRIVFYDRTGVLIDSIPNFRTWIKTDGSRAGRAMFHVFRNELYYTDIFSDTLFYIKDFTLQPKFI
ncbi:MAG: 6-bladed beta-propeller, partial [Tannerella sp.]|nr:6-bladed beta-propeller [Tannerella sp.]